MDYIHRWLSAILQQLSTVLHWALANHFIHDQILLLMVKQTFYFLYAISCFKYTDSINTNIDSYFTVVARDGLLWLLWCHASVSPWDFQVIFDRLTGRVKNDIIMLGPVDNVLFCSCLLCSPLINVLLSLPSLQSINKCFILVLASSAVHQQFPQGLDLWSGLYAGRQRLTERVSRRFPQDLAHRLVSVTGRDSRSHQSHQCHYHQLQPHLHSVQVSHELVGPWEILMWFYKCNFQSCFTDWYLQIFLW